MLQSSSLIHSGLVRFEARRHSRKPGRVLAIVAVLAATVASGVVISAGGDNARATRHTSQPFDHFPA